MRYEWEFERVVFESFPDMLSAQEVLGRTHHFPLPHFELEELHRIGVEIVEGWNDDGVEVVRR